MHDNTQLTNVINLDYHAIKYHLQRNCSKHDKTGNVHKQRHTIISTIVIISVVKLRCLVHRESIKNDGNILACCMVFTVSQSGSEGSGGHTEAWVHGQLHSRGRGKKNPRNRTNKSSSIE